MKAAGALGLQEKEPKTTEEWVISSERSRNKGWRTLHPFSLKALSTFLRRQFGDQPGEESVITTGLHEELARPGQIHH